jgi:hypothetical protein
VLVVSHDLCVEAVLEEMAAPVISLVEPLRVAKVQEVHPA